MIALLVSGNLIFRALCDTELDREHAAALARQALRVDPVIDARLARELANTAAADGGGNGRGMAERLLEILGEISDGRRILSSLMRIMRSDNPYLRSKAVLLIGRSGRSLSWIQRRLEESDTRVRGNAIEAMWGVDTPEARELLAWAARDSNNRVAGNALLGLYKLGETSPLAELLKMAGHDFPAFRRTAAWVMGNSGDPRFSEVLGRMIADGNAEVRKCAFTAVGRIRAAVAQVAQSPVWPVAAVAGRKNPLTGQRCVRVAVLAEDGRTSPHILPVQFMLAEQGQTIWSYRVMAKPAPEPFAVTFLFPRNSGNGSPAWDRDGLRCLQWKRSTDLWSLVPYSGVENAPPGDDADLELPSFIANVAQAAQVFRETPSRADCTGFWTAVQRAIQPANPGFRGRRHLIILVFEEVSVPAGDQLVTAFQASRMSVQVVSAAANPGLREFCRRVDGRFQRVQSESDIEESVSMAYLGLLARYEIRYVPAADAGPVKLRVHTPAGCGETLVELAM